MPTLVPENPQSNKRTSQIIESDFSGNIYDATMSLSREYVLIYGGGNALVLRFDPELSSYRTISDFKVTGYNVWYHMSDDGYVVLGSHYGHSVHDGLSGTCVYDVESYRFEEETYGFAVSHGNLVDGFVCAGGMCGELLVMQIKQTEGRNLVNKNVFRNDAFCMCVDEIASDFTGRYFRVASDEDPTKIFDTVSNEAFDDGEMEWKNVTIDGVLYEKSFAACRDSQILIGLREFNDNQSNQPNGVAFDAAKIQSNWKELGFGKCRKSDSGMIEFVQYPN
ncbi:hypothetical protein PCE1_004892 [Barthelona sp. PCE]